ELGVDEYDEILSNAYYKRYTLVYDFYSSMGKEPSIVKCWHNLDTDMWIVSEKCVHDGYGYEIAYFTKDESHAAIEHWRDVFNSFEFIEKETPGFEAVFAIIGLLIVTYLLRRRK
ncbi:MAG: PGF-CTERM sorting domain-containing protein, partial [Proteobacteria bacterium]|nr:PGF-CTERM sorting domain-containing protein [Pseudomonadota bacterium]